MNIKRIRIADTEDNRNSLFWKNHIGKNGVWTATSGDGLCDIAFDDPPIVVEGVSPNRFVAPIDRSALESLIATNRHLAWRRFRRIMEATAFVLVGFLIVCAIYWALR